MSCKDCLLLTYFRIFYSKIEFLCFVFVYYGSYYTTPLEDGWRVRQSKREYVKLEDSLARHKRRPFTSVLVSLDLPVPRTEVQGRKVLGATE